MAEDERCLFTAGNKLDLWEFLKCGKNSGNASAKVSAVMPGLTGASGADFRISINVETLLGFRILNAFSYPIFFRDIIKFGDNCVVLKE